MYILLCNNKVGHKDAYFTDLLNDSKRELCSFYVNMDVTLNAAKSLANSFVSYGFDYCNTLLHDVPKRTFSKLQHFQTIQQPALSARPIVSVIVITP